MSTILADARGIHKRTIIAAAAFLPEQDGA
jgi:hypothetical protein